MCKAINLLEQHSVEYDYIEVMLESASQNLSDEYVIVAKHCWQQLPTFDGKKIVLIENSNETHGVPREILRDDVHIIFSSYFILDQWGNPIYSHKLLPLPLPHPVAEVNNVTPINERKYDFSFIGQVQCGARHNLRLNLEKIQEAKDCPYSYYIHYTDGFGTGIPSEEYLDILDQSKIALCPAGDGSLETFRFFEASRAGCITVSEQLPKLWFYEKSPWVCGRWSSIQTMLQFILSREKEFLHEAHLKTLKFYEECASPYYIGKYVSHNTLNRKHDELPQSLVTIAQNQQGVQELV